MNYIIEKTKRKIKLNKKNTPYPTSVKTIHSDKEIHFKNLQDVILPKKIKEFSKNSTNKFLEKEISDIKNRVEEVDYYFKTAKILNEYFALETNPEKDGNSRKIEIVRDYFLALNLEVPKEYYMDLRLDCDTCKICGNSEDIIETYDEGMVCGVCGNVLDLKNISSKASYKEQQTLEYVTVMEYKRVDYFKQWLNQIQAKEQTEIPQDVIDTVVIQLKSERILNTNKVTDRAVKSILKKKNYSRYYEHVPSIINIINKSAPLVIPSYLEKKLIAMFEEIQQPWENLKSKERKNFFSYPYTIHKFCQILNLKEYLPYFPLLKSREKLYKQDITWKKIMEFLSKNPSKKDILNDVVWKYYTSF